MCTYCGTDKYRKIYKNHYGLIPKDQNGRTYDIHHIDGNHSNNDPTNLTAVTIQEHYDIHYAQKDWAACYILAHRMKLCPTTVSALASKRNISKANQGLLPMQIASKNGTHPWAELAKQGKHPAQVAAKNGTHFGQTRIFTPAIRAEIGQRITGNNNPTKKHRKICPHCSIEVGIGNYAKSHGDKCKHNPANANLPPHKNPTKLCECCNRAFGVNVLKRHQKHCFELQQQRVLAGLE